MSQIQPSEDLCARCLQVLHIHEKVVPDLMQQPVEELMSFSKNIFFKTKDSKDVHVSFISGCFSDDSEMIVLGVGEGNYQDYDDLHLNQS